MVHETKAVACGALILVIAGCAQAPEPAEKLPPVHRASPANAGASKKPAPLESKDHSAATPLLEHGADTIDAALFRDLPEYELLRKADSFMGSAVGDGGVPSEQGTAFRLLLQSSHADAAFKDLLARADLPGQLYALCGIYFTDHPAFQAAAEKYARIDEEITACLHDCIIDRVAVRRLVRLDGRGVVRLAGPKDTLEDWKRRERWPADKSMEIDILGGGIPHDFLLHKRDPETRWPLDGMSPEEREPSYWIRWLAEGADSSCEGLERLGPRALPAIFTGLDHESADVRACAATILRDWGPPVLLTRAREAGRRLGPLLFDAEESVRQAASHALRRLGPWAVDALPEIRKALAASNGIDSSKERDEYLGDLFSALFRIGPKSVPCLEYLLAHRDTGIRGKALRTLGDLGKDAASSAPRVLQAMADDDLAVRASAVWAIGNFGQATEPILAALRAARHDDAIVLRFHAALALWKLGRESERGTCEFLLEGIAYPNDDAFHDFLSDAIIEEARRVIVEMGKSNGDCLDGLKLTMEEGPRDARSEAAALLGKIGPKAVAAVPALAHLVADDDVIVRQAAIEALGAIGPAARPALPAVLGALNDGEAEVRSAAREAAAKIR